MLSQSTRDFARHMALQAIGHWRRSKASGLAKNAGYHRRYALYLLHAYRTGYLQ